MNVSIITKAVEESRLQKKEIAEQSGITRVTLDNLLKGGDVKVSTLEAVAKVLGIEAYTLFIPADNNSQSDNGSVALAGSTNTGSITAHGDSGKLKEKCALLERIIKEKETIIQEKERLIQLLLNKLN